MKIFLLFPQGFYKAFLSQPVISYRSNIQTYAINKNRRINQYYLKSFKIWGPWDKNNKVKWKLLSRVQLFVTPWINTVHGILQARILEWVAFPFSKNFSQPGDWTQVSRIAGRFFTSWHWGNPRILEWLAYPFSSQSSWPRNRTGISNPQTREVIAK